MAEKTLVERLELLTLILAPGSAARSRHIRGQMRCLANQLHESNVNLFVHPLLNLEM